jgi:hypothetical protein
MFRTPTLAALGLALMSSVALAQPAGNYPDSQGNGPANAPPAQMSPQDRDGDDQGPPPPRSQAQSDPRARDMFCRRDAAARTGYVSPGQAANREQANGTVGGTVLGAAAGAAIGSASGHAGAGALIGAGAGMIAGTAVGADNARRAASDVEQDYAAAYYDCMDEADGPPPPQGYGPQQAYGYGPPPPPGDYYYGPYGPYPYPYYGPYYGPGYYGPVVSFGFGGGRGFGGGFHGGGGGHHR